MIADGLVGPRGILVDVVKADGAAKGRLQGQIRHKRLGPAAGPASDVGDLDIGNSVVGIEHDFFLLLFSVLLSLLDIINKLSIIVL